MQEQLLSCHWGVVQRLEENAGVQDRLFSRATQPLQVEKALQSAWNV